MGAIDEIKAKYPWPKKKPNVSPDGHGWLVSSTARCIKSCLGPKVREIIELGSWIGMSTRFILKNCPGATIYAVDHWKGSPEHYREGRTDTPRRLPILYETFLVNCWEYIDRLVPVRESTTDGLHVLAKMGANPDVIYVDAGHLYKEVTLDLNTAHKLFPRAKLVGDDYLRKSVRDAVADFAKTNGFKVYSDSNGYRLDE